MSTDKVYILQKDLPDHKAGTKFYYDKTRGKYKIDTEVINACEPYSCYMSRWVENNPEWFKPEENKSNDSFQWTQELQEKYIHILEKELFKNGMLPESFRKTFVELNTPKPQAENVETYNCANCGKDTRLHEPPKFKCPENESDCEAAFYAARKTWASSSEKHPSYYLYQTYEDYKNKTPQAENKPDRDWEILEFVISKTFLSMGGVQPHNLVLEEDGKYHGVWNISFRLDELINHPDVKIHSVKRLSDGEVFSVGDEVEYKCDDAPWDEFWVGKIESIRQILTYSKENQIEFKIHDQEWKYQYVHKFISNIRHAKKLPPQPQKEEQGVCKSDSGHCVNSNVCQELDKCMYIDRAEKSKPTEQRPRIQVIKFQSHRSGRINQYELEIDRAAITSDKFEAIKQAIEQVLNDER